MIDRCDHPKAKKTAFLCNGCARKRDSHMYRAGTCPDCGKRCRAGRRCRSCAQKLRGKQQRESYAERDYQITRAWQAGVTVAQLAGQWSVTTTRIYQIVEQQLGKKPNWKTRK